MDRPEDRLALIELFERDARPSRMVDVHQWPVAIGRALTNHIVLEDPFAAAQHARLELDASGQLVITALESRNGASLNGARLVAGVPQPVPAAGAWLQIGATRLRLRLPDETLPAEKPLPRLSSNRLAAPLAAGVALLALQLAVHWLALDPGADYSAWLSTLLGLPTLVAGWCAVWALMSKLFQHRFDFLGHLRIALPGMLGVLVVQVLWPQAMATVGAPALWQWTSSLTGLLIALLVWAHLVHMLPLYQRAVTITVAAAVVVGGAISLALTYRSHDNFRNAPYMSTLPLPALRWAGSVPSAQLVQDMAALQARLASRAKKARDDEESDSGEATAE